LGREVVARLQLPAGESACMAPAACSVTEAAMALARINAKLLGLAKVSAASAESLPEHAMPVWTSSMLALDSAANFLSLLSESGTVTKVVHAAWLLQTSASALCDSYSFAVAQASGLNKEPLNHHSDPAPQADGEAPAVRALCPECREFYEWAPAQYGGVLRMIAASRLAALKLRCSQASEEIRKHVALQRRRFRKFVDDELEILFTEIVSGQLLHSASSPSAASRASRLIEGLDGSLAPNHVLETLKLRSSELKSRRRRLQQREELTAIRQTIADELMQAADAHLEEVWQERMKDALLEDHPLPSLYGECSSPKDGGCGPRSPGLPSCADDHAEQLDEESGDDTGKTCASSPLQFRLDTDDPVAQHESYQSTVDNTQDAIRHYELADVKGINSESGKCTHETFQQLCASTLM